MSDNTYVIYSSSGKKYEVDEFTTNRDTSLTLIGHGMPDYGEDQNTNFLHLLENFSSKEEPINPVVGQIWNDTSDDCNELKMCSKRTDTETVWVKIPFIFDENSNQSNKKGDIKYDSTTQSLYVYDNTNDGGDNIWIKIGPNKKDYMLDFIIPSVKENDRIYSRFLLDEFKKDIDLNMSGSTGNLSMVKITIMVKESEGYNQRSCGWLYTFLLRSKKDINDMYDIQIIGMPNYELIGRSPNTDTWSVVLDHTNRDYIDIELKGYTPTDTQSKLDFVCHYNIIRI